MDLFPTSSAPKMAAGQKKGLYDPSMILLALGANLPSIEGAPRETLRRALSALEKRGVRTCLQSDLFLTEPVPRSDQPWYVNQIACVKTSLAPAALLVVLLEVERSFGRRRSEPNAARPLDLDLLAYDDAFLETDDLTLPHPRLHERAFVLAPLVDIAPDWRHPVLGETARTLLARLDLKGIRRLKPVPLLMGIVNVTPDSFSDEGRFAASEAAIAHAFQLMDDGADILDIGGESTRPGAVPVAPHDEQARVLPVIKAIAETASKRHRPVSIDTRHAATMAKAVAAGATMINDVSALSSLESRRAAAEAGVPVILMHMKGDPQTMQQDPFYIDVVGEVRAALLQACDRAAKEGVDPDQIWFDPGLGFGKTLEHNLALLRIVPLLKQTGHRVLIGASRKSFIGRIDRGGPADQRLGGSIAAALAAARHGADAVRVHDVAETRQALAVWSALDES